jgi:hypothetical protein
MEILKLTEGYQIDPGEHTVHCKPGSLAGYLVFEGNIGYDMWHCLAWCDR